MIMISSNFIFNFTNFCVIVSFLTKLLTLAVLFSTAVRTVIVSKLVILGTSPLASFILALREALVARLKMSGISSSIFLAHALYIYLFQQYKLLGTFFNLSVSNLSTSDF